MPSDLSVPTAKRDVILQTDKDWFSKKEEEMEGRRQKNFRGRGGILFINRDNPETPLVYYLRDRGGGYSCNDFTTV